MHTPLWFCMHLQYAYLSTLQPGLGEPHPPFPVSLLLFFYTTPAQYPKALIHKSLRRTPTVAFFLTLLHHRRHYCTLSQCDAVNFPLHEVRNGAVSRIDQTLQMPCRS